MDGTHLRNSGAITRWLACGVASAIAFGAPQLAQSAGGAASQDGPGSTLHTTDDPYFQQQMAEAIAEAEAAEAERQQPDQVQGREESRQAHQGLNPEQAQDLASQFFGELMLEPSFEAYQPPEGREIDRYLGKAAVLLEPPEPASGLESSSQPEAGSLVQSITPIRVRDESGVLRPTDSQLIPEGDHLEPLNAAVEAELPQELSDGIELPAIDLSVTPNQAAQASSVDVVGEDKAFYAEIATDTDFFASPTEAGVEAFWQLRSEDSPQQLALDLDLPAGASVREAFHGLAAEVVKDGETIAAVDPPQAFDADHTSVPVKMTVEGESVALAIDHRAGDWKYPILLDPAIRSDYWWPGGAPCPAGGYNYPNWRWEQTPYASPFYPGCDSTWGLTTWVPGGRVNWENWWGQWVWAPPRDSYIQQAEFWGSQLAFSQWTDTVCSWMGVYSTRHGYWQAGAPWCSPWDYSDDTWNVAPGDASDDNVAIHQLYFPTTRTYNQDAWTALRGARFMVSDRHSPTVSRTTPRAPFGGETRWVDDSVAGGTATYTVNVSGADRGLGVKKLHLSTPWGTQTRDHGCWDIGYYTCPLNWSQSISYQLPEGRSKVTVQAEDLVGNRSSLPELYQPIDRSAPTTPLLSGSLKDDAAKLWLTRDYELAISASDFIPGGTQPASGVATLKVYVDGALRFETPNTGCTATIGVGGCPVAKNATWTVEAYDLAVGSHAIRVVATDALGHPSEKTLPVVVRDDPQEPQITISAGAPNAQGNYLLTVTSTDPQPPGSPTGTLRSGVESLDIYLDGVQLGAPTKECPQANCSLTWSREMSVVSQSLVVHEVAVEAYDRAGNSAIGYGGKKDPVSGGFETFGYNDDFGNEDVAKAGDGAANVIRFPVAWCEIEQTATGGFNWAPSNAHRLLGPLGKVQTYNASHPNRPIMTIPVLFNAPVWADGVSGNGTSGCPADRQPPADASLNRWGAFVQAFAQQYRTTGSIMAIEAWNEPNLAAYWGGGIQGPTFSPDPRRFAKLVNVANASTTIPILPGGLATADQVYDSKMSEDDPAPYMLAATDPATTDPEQRIKTAGLLGLSLHLYANKAKVTKTANKRIRERYNEFTGGLRTDYVGLDRYITEIGFPSSGAATTGLEYATEKKQRQRLRSAYRHFAAEPKIRAFIVHRLRDQVSADPGAENGRLGLVHGGGEHGNAAKDIYCYLAGRVAEFTPSCEAQNAHE